MHDFQTRRQKISLCESCANRTNDFSAREDIASVVAFKKNQSKALARSRTKKNTERGEERGRAPALSARSSRVGCPFNTCGRNEA